MRSKSNTFGRKVDKTIGIITLWIISVFRKNQKDIPKNVKQILVSRLAIIGNTILLLPILKAIKAKYPNAEGEVIDAIKKQYFKL